MYRFNFFNKTYRFWRAFVRPFYFSLLNNPWNKYVFRKTNNSVLDINQTNFKLRLSLNNRLCSPFYNKPWSFISLCYLRDIENVYAIPPFSLTVSTTIGRGAGCSSTLEAGYNKGIRDNHQHPIILTKPWQVSKCFVESNSWSYWNRNTNSFSIISPIRYRFSHSGCLLIWGHYHHPVQNKTIC